MKKLVKYFTLGVLMTLPVMVLASTIPAGATGCCDGNGVNCSACATQGCCVVGCTGGGVGCGNAYCTSQCALGTYTAPPADPGAG